MMQLTNDGKRKLKLLMFRHFGQVLNIEAFLNYFTNPDDGLFNDDDFAYFYNEKELGVIFQGKMNYDSFDTCGSVVTTIMFKLKLDGNLLSSRIEYCYDDNIITDSSSLYPDKQISNKDEYYAFAYLPDNFKFSDFINDFYLSNLKYTKKGQENTEVKIRQKDG